MNWISITGKQTKCSDKPPGVFAVKDLILLSPSKNKMLSYSAMRRTYLADGEYQISFKPSHYHTTGNTRGTFEGRKCYHCNWSPSCCQSIEAWEGCRLRWNPTWNAQSLESRRSLTDSCVLGGLVFWNGTERLANCGDHALRDMSECAN